MIGENAVQPKKDLFAPRAQRLNMMLHAYMLAEASATKEFPLIDTPREIGVTRVGEAALFRAADAHMSPTYKVFLGVGDLETGFYQVPLIQVRKGIDAQVTGSIGLDGVETRLERPKRFTAVLDEQEPKMERTRQAERTYAVALVPKTEHLGEQLLLGASGARVTDGYRHPSEGFDCYRLALNGFLSERVFVNPRDGSKMPFLVQDKGGKEHYLRLSEVAHRDGLEALAEKGIFPGVYLASGGFRLGERRRVLPRLNQPIGALYAQGAEGRDYEQGTLGERLQAKGVEGADEVGRLGVDVGRSAKFRYQAASGEPLQVESVFAVHLLPVTTDMDPDRIRREIARLV